MKPQSPPTPRLPYPQTPKSAQAYIRAHGLCVAQMARDMGVARTVLVDLLRGQLKGHRGDAHRAAVALGLKADPAALDDQAAA